MLNASCYTIENILMTSSLSRVRKYTKKMKKAGCSRSKTGLPNQAAQPWQPFFPRILAFLLCINASCYTVEVSMFS